MRRKTVNKMQMQITNVQVQETEMVQYVNTLDETSNGMNSNGVTEQMPEHIDSNNDFVTPNGDDYIVDNEYDGFNNEVITPNGDEFMIADDEFVIHGEGDEHDGNHIVTKGNHIETGIALYI
eukprot:UN11214